MKRELVCRYFIGELCLLTSRAAYLNNALRSAMGWCAGGQNSQVLIYQTDGVTPVARVTDDGVKIHKAGRSASIKPCGPRRDRG